MFSGCSTSPEELVKRQIGDAMTAIASCDLTSQTLQPLFYSDLENTMYRLQQYTDLEVVMMCSLYRLMYDQTWTIKSVEIVNDTAIATIVYTHYDTQRFLNDLALHLKEVFGIDLLLEKHENENAQEPRLDDARIEEIEAEAMRFVQDKGFEYALSTYQTTTISFIHFEGKWLIQSLEQLSFVVE